MVLFLAGVSANLKDEHLRCAMRTCPRSDTRWGSTGLGWGRTGCSAAYPTTNGTTNAGGHRYTAASRKIATAKPDLARDLFELQHRRPGLKRRMSPHSIKHLEPELRSGFGCMESGTAGNGARGHASEFPRSTQSQTIHKQGPKRGSAAARTADTDTKQWRQKTAREPPTPQERREGQRDGAAGGGG